MSDLIENNKEKIREDSDENSESISSDNKLPQIFSVPLDRIKAILTVEDEIITANGAKIEEKEEFQLIEYKRIAPLPPPEEFRKYEAVLSGAADRILSMTERQASHRQLMENKNFELEAKTLDIRKNDLISVRSIETRGQIFGLIIAIIIILIGALLIYSGHDTAGTLIMISCLVGLATVFVTGRKKSSTTNSQ